jgi:hypothetical protein
MYNNRLKKHTRHRRGTMAVLGGIMLTALLGMVAFAVDYGYLVKTHADMQRAADVAVLAATQELIPAADGTQDLGAVRAAVRRYVASNLDNPSFQVPDADIEIGRYNPDTIYSNLTLLNSGTYDTVRITLRRDGNVNPLVSFFFAKILGTDATAVTAMATAILQKASKIVPGIEVLPFAVPATAWDSKALGEDWNIYGNGQIKDANGANIPGNWGTVDLGHENNSTSDISAQIANGLRQTDLNKLYDNGRIGDLTHIDASEPMWLSADTGMSSGIRSAVEQVHGRKFAIPIYGPVSGGGNTTEFEIIGWGMIELVTSDWNGNNSSITIKKTSTYDNRIRPDPDLSEVGIDGAYTAPALVQ